MKFLLASSPACFDLCLQPWLPDWISFPHPKVLAYKFGQVALHLTLQVTPACDPRVAGFQLLGVSAILLP